MDIQLSTRLDVESMEINGYNDYIIYNDGRVYSKKSNRFLKPTICRGYPCIKLNLANRKQKFFSIHTLVAQHFIPNPNNLPEVNHKDGNKLNPVYTNLEWCTRSENVQHAYDTGLITPQNAKEVIQIYNGREICRFTSARQASINTGVCKSSIIQVCNHKQLTAGGYKWRYTNE